MKNIFSHKRNFLILSAIVFCFIFSFILSCKKENDPMLVVNGPAPYPKLPSVPYQYSNGNNDLATLGRVIFYDKNLSLNNAISCGSCHKQQYAFAENHQFSRGLNNGYTSRNASAILGEDNSYNTPHHKFWDGRAANFDTAVFMPVMNHLEMNIFDLNILPQKFSQITYYPDLFKAAFGTTEINVSRIRHALASFVDNLISNNSKLDNNNLSAFELQGENIFIGKGRCYSCHNGNNLNSFIDSYENIGLDVNYSDIGRGRITKINADDGKFHVPTLRNIALTAPYMHDGRYNSLREVIDHYSEGIQDSKNLSWKLRDIPGLVFNDSIIFFNQPPANVNLNNLSSYPVMKISLTDVEKKSLEAFLNTLTDVSFITDPKLSNPF